MCSPIATELGGAYVRGLKGSSRQHAFQARSAGFFSFSCYKKAPRLSSKKP